MTDSCKRWPTHLMKMVVHRSPPQGCTVVPGSTPVVSFGDPIRATVATIGFNPASAEFRGNRGLATLKSLGILDYKAINCCLGAKILDGCAGYFGQNPYDRWFLPLDGILRAGARASYYADSRSDARYLDLACHLDLAQWATSDRWGVLSPPQKKKLLNDGFPLLRQQISQGHYRLLIINGSGVKNLIDRFQFRPINWRKVRSLEREQGKPGAKLHEAVCGNTLFLAWSCNIQSQPGADRHIPELARFVAEQYDNFLNERRTP